MMRLIDANKLSQIICENVPAPYEDSREAKEECLRIIEEALTIDAVPVVRCKGCKYYEECTHFLFDDDFCSRGERKDEVNEP